MSNNNQIIKWSEFEGAVRGIVRSESKDEEQYQRLMSVLGPYYGVRPVTDLNTEESTSNGKPE